MRETKRKQKRKRTVVTIVKNKKKDLSMSSKLISWCSLVLVSLPPGNLGMKKVLGGATHIGSDQVKSFGPTIPVNC